MEAIALALEPQIDETTASVPPLIDAHPYLASLTIPPPFPRAPLAPPDRRRDQAPVAGGRKCHVLNLPRAPQLCRRETGSQAQSRFVSQNYQRRTQTQPPSDPLPAGQLRLEHRRLAPQLRAISLLPAVLLDQTSQVRLSHLRDREDTWLPAEEDSQHAVGEQAGPRSTLACTHLQYRPPFRPPALPGSQRDPGRARHPRQTRPPPPRRR